MYKITLLEFESLEKKELANLLSDHISEEFNAQLNNNYGRINLGNFGVLSLIKEVRLFYKEPPKNMSLMEISGLHNFPQITLLIDMDKFKTIAKICSSEEKQLFKQSILKILDAEVEEILNMEYNNSEEKKIEVSKIINQNEAPCHNKICNITSTNQLNDVNENNRHPLSKISIAMDYIENNCTQDLTLEQVSSQVRLSSPYFSRLFKRKTGNNFKKYVTAVRLQKAIKYFRANNLTIKDIALQVGYGEARYFSYVFKKYYGITPSEYRKTIQ